MFQPVFGFDQKVARRHRVFDGGPHGDPRGVVLISDLRRQIGEAVAAHRQRVAPGSLRFCGFVCI
jgi:hypothetical protein